MAKVRTVHYTIPVTVELRSRIEAAARAERRSAAAWGRCVIEDRLAELDVVADAERQGYSVR